MILAYIRTLLLYLLLVVSLRLMGKRQIGQMETPEFVVAMLIADLAAVPMQNSAIPLLSGAVPLLTVLGLELTVSFLVMKSIAFRKLFCGRPVILIDNGRVEQGNLRRTRITMDELMSHLRQKDVLDVTQVQYAILETDGNLSVFPFPAAGTRSLPVTVINDGQLSREGLARAGKDAHWLRSTLGKYRARQDTTLLLTVDGEGTVVWIGKED